MLAATHRATLAAPRPGASALRTRAPRVLAPRARSIRVLAGLGDAVGNFLNEGKKQFTIQQAGEYDAAAVGAKVDQLIKDNSVMVFSWSGCPYCKKAKGLLDEVGAKYTALELDTIPDGKAIRAELTKKTGRTSVPNIFIQGQGVGGCNDGPGVMTLQSQGKLQPMLKAAGAL